MLQNQHVLFVGYYANCRRLNYIQGYWYKGNTSVDIYDRQCLEWIDVFEVASADSYFQRFNNIDLFHDETWHDVSNNCRYN